MSEFLVDNVKLLKIIQDYCEKAGIADKSTSLKIIQHVIAQKSSAISKEFLTNPLLRENMETAVDKIIHASTSSKKRLITS